MFHRSAELYDAIYAFKDYRREAEALRDIIERHTRSGGHALLDVACGTGTHLTHLREWFDVQGMELSPEMLAVARRKLPGVLVHDGDMLDFHLDRPFDVVLCLFSSIGYVRTVDRLREAVLNLARHVAPGGILVIEPWLFPEVYRPGHLFAQLTDEPDLKVARVGMSELVDRLSVLHMHHLLATPAGVEYFEERHELGLFTHDEYESAMRSAGMDVLFDPAGLTGRGLFVGLAPSAGLRPE